MIIGLSEFGLTARALRSTPQRTVTYCIQLRGPQLGPLKHLTPSQRNRSLAAHLKGSIAALTQGHHFTSFQPRSTRRPWSIDAVSDARAFLALARSPHVRSLSVSKVSGARRRTRAQGPLLFTVRARVVVQVEGQSRGMQTVEERFITVRASTEAEALRALRPMWRLYAEPYLNPYGQLVRWHLEEVLEVYRTYDSQLSPSGTEVYSRLSSRRVNPGLVWRP